MSLCEVNYRVPCSVILPYKVQITDFRSNSYLCNAWNPRIVIDVNWRIECRSIIYAICKEYLRVSKGIITPDNIYVISICWYGWRNRSRQIAAYDWYFTESMPLLFSQPRLIHLSCIWSRRALAGHCLFCSWSVRCVKQFIIIAWSQVHFFLLLYIHSLQLCARLSFERLLKSSTYTVRYVWPMEMHVPAALSNLEYLVTWYIIFDQ